MLQADMTVSCTISFCAGWANVNYLAPILSYMKWAHHTHGLAHHFYGLLWANSNSLAKTVVSNHGPMQARLSTIVLTESYVGPHGSPVRQPSVFSMGQCELIVQM